MNTGWRKATASADNSYCVKVRFGGDDVQLGDTKNTHLGEGEPILRFPATRWGETLVVLQSLRPTR